GLIDDGTAVAVHQGADPTAGNAFERRGRLLLVYDGHTWRGATGHGIAQQGVVRCLGRATGSAHIAEMVRELVAMVAGLMRTVLFAFAKLLHHRRAVGRIIRRLWVTALLQLFERIALLAFTRLVRNEGVMPFLVGTNSHTP